jgi:hypothetical protein
MLVTITGAYRNAGDHLIGLRARLLLKHILGEEARIVNLDRRTITPAHYETLNQARVVLLTGGPALNPDVFPGIYPLDLERITAPVLLYGVGAKSPLGSDPSHFQFEPATESGLKRIHHGNGLFSSVREDASKTLLNKHGIQNVLMTGCPVWYDLDHLDEALVLPGEIKKIVISAPAAEQRNFPDLLKQIAKRFPQARKVLVFQAGLGVPRPRYRGLVNYNRGLLRLASNLGVEIADTQSNVERMIEVMSDADLHVGYRVHQHLLALSARKLSLLISEDNRGIAQSVTLSGQEAIIPATATASEVMRHLDSTLSTEAEAQKKAVAKMQATWPVMRRFLEQFI